MQTRKLQKPDAQQLQTIASILKDELLPRWGVKDISTGIQRVGVTEVGFVTEVYVSPGIFATLCYYRYSNRTRKPFQVNGFTVKQWRPDSQQLHRGKK